MGFGVGDGLVEGDRRRIRGWRLDRGGRQVGGGIWVREGRRVLGKEMH